MSRKNDPVKDIFYSLFNDASNGKLTEKSVNDQLSGLPQKDLNRLKTMTENGGRTIIYQAAGSSKNESGALSALMNFGFNPQQPITAPRMGSAYDHARRNELYGHIQVMRNSESVSLSSPLDSQPDEEKKAEAEPETDTPTNNEGDDDNLVSTALIDYLQERGRRQRSTTDKISERKVEDQRKWEVPSQNQRTNYFSPEWLLGGLIVLFAGYFLMGRNSSNVGFGLGGTSRNTRNTGFQPQQSHLSYNEYEPPLLTDFDDQPMIPFDSHHDSNSELVELVVLGVITLGVVGYVVYNQFPGIVAGLFGQRGANLQQENKHDNDNQRLNQRGVVLMSDLYR